MNLVNELEVNSMKKITLLFTLLFLLITYSSFPQWYYQNPYPQPNGLSGTFFIDDNIGWAVGGEGTIIKTTDGGNVESVIDRPARDPKVITRRRLSILPPRTCRSAGCHH